MKLNKLKQLFKLHSSLITKTKIFVVICLIFSCSVQKNNPKSEVNFGSISQDKLGNIYHFGNMKIIKYSSELDTLRTNSIFSNGTISSLDTRNPLQLMLFYKQQQELILLDNTLSETNNIKLNFLEWIDLACMSNRDNAFWLYSITNQSLIKTDKTGKVINKFQNIGQLVNRDINPTQLIEYDNSVYLFDSNQGLFVFDLYGNYTKRIQLENAETIKFYEKKVFFRLKNDIFSYNMINFDKKLEFQSNENFDDFEIGKSGILLLDKDKINIK